MALAAVAGAWREVQHHLVEAQAYQLGDAKAGRESETEHGTVAYATAPRATDRATPLSLPS